MILKSLRFSIVKMKQHFLPCPVLPLMKKYQKIDVVFFNILARHCVCSFFLLELTINNILSFLQCQDSQNMDTLYLFLQQTGIGGQVCVHAQFLQRNLHLNHGPLTFLLEELVSSKGDSGTQSSEREYSLTMDVDKQMNNMEI